MGKRIPPELEEALSTDGGYSLLIKGAPGTGKTMLALEILRESGANAVYITTRVSPQALYGQFPWLRECIEPENLIEATKLYVNLDAFPAVHSFPEVLYARLSKIKPATVVIDSWEAITSQMDAERRESLEATMIEAVSHNKTKLILVSERLETSPLDYMVDGIVTLRRITVDYRRARELEIEKLRGVRIDQHKYAFTLEGGRFQCFEPFKRRKVEKQRKVEIIPHSQTHLSTGIADLDKFIGGGFKRGSFNLINVSDGISTLGYQSIIAHIIINSIQQGTHCVCVPCCGWNEHRLRREILPFVREHDYYEYFTVFEIEGCSGARGAGEGEEERKRGHVKLLKGESIREDLSEFGEFIAGLEPPVMVIIGADTLEYPYQLRERGRVGEMVSLLSKLMVDMREVGNVCVFGVTPSLALRESLAYMSEVCIKLTVLDKSVVLYCERPDTKLYCLENVITDESLKIKLTAFV